MSHAGHLDATGNAIDMAKRAAYAARPSTGAYGELCQWVPQMLGQLQDVVLDAVASGAHSLYDTADTLRVIGSQYAYTRDANAAQLRRAAERSE
ncbi:ESX-1 secretion-associated protein [Rugosimonospora acidiphila]